MNPKRSLEMLKDTEISQRVWILHLDLRQQREQRPPVISVDAS